MSAPSQFPAFLSIEYDGRGDGFPAFERAANSSFGQVEGRLRQFTRSFEEVGRVASKAIAGGVSKLGGIDLGVGQLRQFAAEARLSEAVLKELQRTTTDLALKTGDTSQATKLYTQAIGAQVIEARQATAQAEAQVATYARLQTALDGVADKNSRLASSFREVYLEQAKAAQQEVSARKTQEAYNSIFAPGLTRSASSSGAGYGALEEALVRRNALIDELNSNVQELERRFEREGVAAATAAQRAQAAIAAQNAEIQRQAQLLADQAREQANVKANNDRFTLSSRATENGAGYSALAVELERLEEAERQAALVAKEYEQALFNIRQQVDPAYFAQKRFNQELAFADHALKSGDITAGQYAQRLAFLRGEMALNAASTRQMRFASVQLGQQLQDVVIQAQMGTNAFVILAQQGSQMAFALTESGGKVGALARIMAGWQGAIVFAGIALVGQLIPALIGTSKESDNAKQSTLDFSNSIVASTGLVGNYTKAIEQLSQATRGLINTQALIIDNTQAFAQNAVSQLQSQLAELDGQIGKLNAKSPITDFLFNANQNAFQLARLQKERAAISVNLRDAQNALAQAQTAMEARKANEAADPKAAQQAQIDRERARLLERRQYTLQQGPVPLQDANQNMLISETDFNREMQSLKRREEALRKNESASKEVAAANARMRLEERGEDVAKKIANITDRFSDIPPQVRSVNSAMRELDDLANDFSKKKPPNYEQIVKAIEDAKKAIRENGLDQPVNDLLEAQQQQLVIADLQARGREAEAAAMQQILTLERQRGPLSQAQKDAILESNIALRNQTRELERQQAYQRNLLNFVQAQRDAVNGLVYNLLSGKGLSSVGGFVKGVFNNYLRALSDEITNSLTANFFQKQTDRIKGETKLSDAGVRMAKSVDLLKAALDDLRKSVKGAAGDIADAGAQATTGAANDNDIVVTGRKSVSATLKDGLKDLGKSIFGEKAAAKFGEIASKGMQGAAIGTATSGILKSLGVKQSTTGAQIGGALGNFIPGLPPGVGSVIGSLIGGTIGGLFKKTKWGAVTVNSSGASAGSGNSSSAIGAAVQAGGAFNNQLRQIADALGGNIGNFGNITIGQRKGDWRVNSGGTSLKVKKGAVDFNGDGEAAIAYAVGIALERGAITGIRNSTSNLLKAAGDMQEKLSKALSFENVFRDLRKIKDPVGAAISDLNLEYNKLIDIFKQAGATTEEWGQLEELYQIKRKGATEDALKSLTGSLDDLYKNLTIGDNGYSLRTRLGNAQSAYDPLAARVAAGDSTAYADFAAAAQTLIELKREYSGSAPDYFATLDQVTALTKAELDRQQSLFSTASGAATPFDTTPIVDATTQGSANVVNALAAVNDNVSRVAANMQQYMALLAQAGRAPFPAARNF